MYVNTAVLSIEKSFQNPYLAAGDGRAENEFRVGEQVNYQVTVNNLQKGSIARNLGSVIFPFLKAGSGRS